MQRSLNQCIFS